MNNLLIEHFHEFEQEHNVKSLKLFSHILNAHTHWNNRILELEKIINWEDYNLNKFNDQNMDNYRASVFILDTHNTNDLVEYKNRIGNMYSQSIHDILFHIINHSTYHRGQIAHLTREANLIPISTDYIFFKREN